MRRKWGKKGKRKFSRIYRTSQNIRLTLGFLESLLLESFPSGMKVLGLLPQPRCPWRSIVVLFPFLHVDHSLEFALWLPWRTWVCRCEGQVWMCCCKESLLTCSLSCHLMPAMSPLPLPCLQAQEPLVVKTGVTIQNIQGPRVLPHSSGSV